jgi:hypothetical protein
VIEYNQEVSPSGRNIGLETTKWIQRKKNEPTSSVPLMNSTKAANPIQASHKKLQYQQQLKNNYQSMPQRMEHRERAS